MIIELDEYEAGNLLWMLEHVRRQDEVTNYNTGDWVCQVLYKLKDAGASLEHSNVNDLNSAG